MRRSNSQILNFMEEIKQQQPAPDASQSLNAGLSQLSSVPSIMKDEVLPLEDDLSPRTMNLIQKDKAQVAKSDGSGNSSQQPLLQAIDILGAVKVRDGLFLGDEFASQDLEFVIANKVTHIINCAGRQIFNQWTPVGVKYLTFYWLDDDRQLIFDDHDQVAKEIFDFIEEASHEHTGVLVHSVRGQSRACCVLSIYLMMKFKWTLLKSLEFVNSRRPNLEIRASFLQQLSAWERRTRDAYPKRTDRWDELHNENDYEEKLLRNTFVNAQMQPVNFLQQWKEDVMLSITNVGQKARGIQWADGEDEAKKKQLARENSDYDLINKDESQIVKIENHKREFKGKPLLKKVKKEEPKDQKVLPKEEPIKNEVEHNKIGTPSNSAPKKADVKQSTSAAAKKRPVTPLLRPDTQSQDLVQNPKVIARPESQLSQHQQQSLKQVPKRSSSSKKITEKDEQDKRDQFKARVAWNATKESPKDSKAKVIVGLTGYKDILDSSLTSAVTQNTAKNMMMNKLMVSQSPSKMNNSSILKKELLEKAKKALAENSKVTVGVDIKKIQETLNKIGKNENNLASQTKLPSGNIINNNNINNFFIQNASVIELPTNQNKQAILESDQSLNQGKMPQQPAIGQHHHKRTSSLVNNNMNGAKKVMHKKNQMSEQISKPVNVPFILQSTVLQEPQLKMPSTTIRPSSQLSQTSKKDFKAMIRDLQKDQINPQTFYNAMKYKNQTPNQQQQQQNILGLMYPYNQSLQDQRSKVIDNTFRPSSGTTSQKQFLGQGRSNSGNRSRRLKKADQASMKVQQTQFKQQRRAQTPMPQSPSTQAVFGLQIVNSAGADKNSQHMFQPQNALMHSQQLIPHMVHQKSSSKRSKSPSTITSYQQKLQAKTAYLLMNNTNFMVQSNVGNLIQQQHKSAAVKPSAASGGYSPKRQ